MAVFKETTGKDFLEKYDGKKLFAEFVPKVASLPNLAYRPFYNKKAGDVVKLALAKGLCTQEQADALEKAFNERYGDK